MNKGNPADEPYSAYEGDFDASIGRGGEINLVLRDNNGGTYDIFPEEVFDPENYPETGNPEFLEYINKLTAAAKTNPSIIKNKQVDNKLADMIDWYIEKHGGVLEFEPNYDEGPDDPPDYRDERIGRF